MGQNVFVAKPQKETWTPGDPAHKKLMAYGIVAVFVGIMAVLGVRSVAGPQLYSGDRQQNMACRLCQGGNSKGCRLCLGRGQVKVIVPGPYHPVEVRGTVRDAGAFAGPEQAQQVADKESREVSLKPVQGAVPGARLVFQSDSKKLTIEGKATGRFRCNLQPGRYRLLVQATGYQDLSLDFQVPARKLPVWPKKPGLDDLDEERLRPVFLLKRP